MPFSSVSIVDFERVNVSWVGLLGKMVKLTAFSAIHFVSVSACRTPIDSRTCFFKGEPDNIEIDFSRKFQSSW